MIGAINQSRVCKRGSWNKTYEILHEFRKMSGKFVSIELVKISFPVEEIYTAELSI